VWKQREKTPAREKFLKKKIIKKPPPRSLTKKENATNVKGEKRDKRRKRTGPKDVVGEVGENFFVSGASGRDAKTGGAG